MDKSTEKKFLSKFKELNSENKKYIIAIQQALVFAQEREKDPNEKKASWAGFLPAQRKGQSMDVNKVANQPTINGKPLVANLLSEKVIILAFTGDNSAIVVTSKGCIKEVTNYLLSIELDEETKSLLRGQEENNGNYWEVFQECERRRRISLVRNTL